MPVTRQNNSQATKNSDDQADRPGLLAIVEIGHVRPLPVAAAVRASTMKVAQLLVQRHEVRLEGHRDRARPREVDAAVVEDAAGPRAHHADAAARETPPRAGRGSPAARSACAAIQSVLQDRPQFFARELVERAERLVEQQHARLVDQRAAQIGALQHAAGELPGIAVAEALEADLLEQRIGLVAELGLAQLGGIASGTAATILSGSMMFCSIVSQGSMVGFWNAMPIAQRLRRRPPGRRR